MPPTRWSPSERRSRKDDRAHEARSLYVSLASAATGFAVSEVRQADDSVWAVTCFLGNPVSGVKAPTLRLSARRFVHDAESALAAYRYADAGAAALMAQVITAHSFLSGIDNRWADEMRRHLEKLRVQALLIQGTAAFGLGDPEEAIRCAERVLALDPYREKAVQILMRACTATGDPTRALAAYEGFRRCIAEVS